MMSNSSLISLDKKIEELKGITENLDIFSVCNVLFHKMLMFSQAAQRIELNSPARQMSFLMGIMVSQKNKGEKEFSDGDYSKVCKILNDVFFKYLNAYFPSKKEISHGLTESWIQSRKVAMPAFISYFFESQKIATDEIRLNILETNLNFEKEIVEHFGISHKDMVLITDRIGDLIQSNMDRIHDIVHRLNEKRLEFANSDVERYYEVLQDLRETCPPLMEEFARLTNESASFELDDIDGVSAEVLERFKELFVVVKGNGGEVKYITEENVIDSCPIITQDGSRFALTSVNNLFFAIEKRIELFFKGSSSYSDRYRKARDKKLETDVRKAFEELLPVDAIVLESVFENNKSFNEHDMFIKVGRTILIVEAKAAPRREPLTDPSRAFTRIRDDFKRKSGIQSGCDQALRLKKLILDNDVTTLYDKKGNELYTINKMDFDEIFCICVTKDEFGLLATDLSILLDKPDGTDYPWVVKITDLKFYFSCLRYVGKNWDYFMSYLRQRIEFMGLIFSSDELEIAGYHIKYGGFGDIKKEGNILIPDMNESTIFDEIHMAKFEGKEFKLQSMLSDYKELDKRKIINKLDNKIKSVKKSNKDQRKARRKNRR
ncbi:hypothetical protein I6L77_05405 [Pantoea agglomerans]|uniref:hypothetical protein n=2 Tax=Enterobacter agglomerans TaxID=549 RepID=UPI001C223F34|nr:hypothetical protein [Pantoea agglomerans]QXB59567.1 hypothetical protein I6L77_05405 [Pantoea agglomerans]